LPRSGKLWHDYGESGIIALAHTQKQSHKSPDVEPQRRNRVATIGPDAGSVARAAFERMGFSEPGLVLRWKEIVGPETARIARPLRLVEGRSGGVLTLKADPAAALFLQHESRALCGRINSYLGRPAVQRLRFVPGEIALEAPSFAGQFTPPQTAPHDPAHRFAGSERLKNALLGLARARALPNDDASN